MEQDIFSKWGFAGLGILAVVGVAIFFKYLGDIVKNHVAVFFNYLIKDFGPQFIVEMKEIRIGQEKITAAMEHTSTVYKETVDSALSHSTKMQERQSITQDNLMNYQKEITTDLKTVITKADTILDKLEGRR